MIVYQSVGEPLYFKRTDDGRWNLYLDGDRQPLWYNKATFAKCT